MSFVRRLSTRRLLAFVAGTVAVIAGGTAIAIAATASTTVPAKESLPTAVRQAMSAPSVQGVTARIQFTNRLIDSSSLPAGTPLLTGATGRLWASADGQARLELQSDSGHDVQILVDGRTVSLYDASAKTVYKATLPAAPAEQQDTTPDHAIPTIAAIERALTHLGTDLNISGATPTNVAGRPAYAVKLSPKHDGGLVGAAQLAWDAATGTPLSVGLYAAGKTDPVLELTATAISYGDVDAGAFDVQPPAGTKVVDLTPQLEQLVAGKSATPGRGAVTTGEGVDAVKAAAGFAVSAPDQLAGLPRKMVRLVSIDGKQGVLAVYGKGLGAIAVFQGPTEKAAAPDAGTQNALPQVTINGAPGTELATALGTFLTFQRDGVTYSIVGSVPPAAAEAAARGL